MACAHKRVRNKDVFSDKSSARAGISPCPNTLYKVELANGRVLEAPMTNAAPGRAKFHEVGDPVAVCWRHGTGVFLRS